MKTDLLASFQELADEFLAAHPNVPHERATGDSSCQLTFPKSDDAGFDVSFDLEADGRYLLATDHGWHDNGEDLAAEALPRYFAMIRDLMSPATRLREFRSAGKPYRWTLEVEVDGQWTTAGSTSLLFWNYLGARSVVVFQNNTLPACRLHADGSVA